MMARTLSSRSLELRTLPVDDARITAFAPPEACLRIAHGSANSLAISSSASPVCSWASLSWSASLLPAAFLERKTGLTDSTALEKLSMLTFLHNDAVRRLARSTRQQL